MAVRPEHGSIYHLDFCSGSGMLGVGLNLALGGRVRTVCHVEREAFAAAALVARMEDKTLDPTPVWDDVATTCDPEFVDFVSPFFDRGLVILSAGYPCQPFSGMGKRLGENDPRHLWPHIARFIERTRPPFCFFENVENHYRVGFTTVYRELETLGYETRAGFFSAREVGANHIRKRFFILALRCDASRGRLQGFQSWQERTINSGTDSRNSGSHAASEYEQWFRATESDAWESVGGPDSATADHRTDTEGSGLEGRRAMQSDVATRERRSGSSDSQFAVHKPVRPDAGCKRCAVQRGAFGADFGSPQRNHALRFGKGTHDWNYLDIVQHGWPDPNGRRPHGLHGEFADDAQRAIEEELVFEECRGELPLFAPSPLDPRIVEFAARHPCAQPGIRRGLHGLASWVDRPDRIRLVGNGVVPLAVAYAFISLFAAFDVHDF